MESLSLPPSLSRATGRSPRVAWLMAPVGSLSVRLPICISSWWSCSHLSRGPFHLPRYTECSLRHRPKRPWCLNAGLRTEPGPERALGTLLFINKHTLMLTFLPPSTGQSNNLITGRGCLSEKALRSLTVRARLPGNIRRSNRKASSSGLFAQEKNCKGLKNLGQPYTTEPRKGWCKQ